MSAPRHQAPRGTRDLLPADTARWQQAEDAARGVLARYGYLEIRTPLFEEVELFARTSGETSDVVQKEMYRFRTLGGDELALRPEGTAGVARAWVQHGMAAQGRVQRLWYMGPMFRYARPQKGRYRQFWQIGAEVVGTAAPGADVEVIALFVDLFEAWGFGDLVVAMNSVGTPATRAAYGAALRAWLAPVRVKLGADSQRRLETNPLRVLDTKDPDELELLKDPALGPMPRLLDTLDTESRAHFDAVIAGLDALGIRHEIDHGLVRGLDYYTRTAFEVHDRSLGAQSALGGGGRYDGLIEAVGGAPTPGVGFSIGLDRVMLVLEGRAAAAPEACEVFVASMEGTRARALALTRALRRAFRVDADLEARGFGAQMKAAGRSGAPLLVIVGEDEAARGEVVLKDLRTGEQRAVPDDRIHDALRAALGRTPTESGTP